MLHQPIRRRRGVRALAPLGSLVLGACQTLPEAPPPRGMEAAQAALDHPTAVLESDQVPQAILLTKPLVDLVDALGQLDIIAQPFDAAADAAEEAFQSRRLKIQGRIVAVGFCEPLVAGEPQTEANGTVTIELGVVASLLQREIGGAMQECQIRAGLREGGPTAVRVSAEIAADFGRPVPLGRVRPQLLDATYRFRNVRTRGFIGAEAANFDVDEIDFRFVTKTPPIRAEVLVHVDPIGVPGTVAIVGTGEGLAVRDSLGLWTCTIRGCTRTP